MNYSLIAFILGFLLDLLLGDPYTWPHPIRWIGNFISFLEKRMNQGDNKRRKGRITVYIVVTTVCTLSFLVLWIGYQIHPILGCLLETIMTYQILATKSLKDESMKVYEALEHSTLENARYCVSMIVGRDTKQLSDAQVTKAAVETVAENTSDGIIAPMFYLAIGGPVLAFFYKSINTMDSMIGYKNDRYLDFGRFAAKLDDVVNYIPARLSALLMIVASVLPSFSTKDAIRIFIRDRYNHASPNSAQCESVCAGALQVQLAGPASYFGKVVDKPTIGDPTRNIEHKDIIRANILLYASAILFEIICIIIKKG